MNEILNFISTREMSTKDETESFLYAQSPDTELKHELIELKSNQEPRNLFIQAGSNYLTPLEITEDTTNEEVMTISSTLFIEALSVITKSLERQFKKLRDEHFEEWQSTHYDSLEVIKEAISTFLLEALEEFIDSETDYSLPRLTTDTFLDLDDLSYDMFFSVLCTGYKLDSLKKSLVEACKQYHLLKLVHTSSLDDELTRVLIFHGYRQLVNSIIVTLPKRIFPLPILVVEPEPQPAAAKIPTFRELKRSIKELKFARRNLDNLEFKLLDRRLQPASSTIPQIGSIGAFRKGFNYLFGVSSKKTASEPNDISSPDFDDEANNELNETTKTILGNYNLGMTQNKAAAIPNLTIGKLKENIDDKIERNKATLLHAKPSHIVLGDLVLNTDDFPATDAARFEPILSELPLQEGPRFWIGELLVVRQKPKAYELADIAHIENILIGEERERVHRRLRQTEEEITSTTISETESERDSQTTEREEISSEIAKEVSSRVQAGGELSLSGKYGPSVKFSSSASAEYERTSASSERRASNFAKEVVERSAERIFNRKEEVRRRRTFLEVEETTKHSFDNTGGERHVSGIYRWLNKIYEGQVYYEGERLIIEIIIPDPASRYIARIYNSNSQEDNLPPKPDLIINDLSDLDDEWLVLAKKYDVTGIRPPQPDTVVVSDTFSNTSGGLSKIANAGTINIPEGYEATAARINMFVIHGKSKWGAVTSINGKSKWLSKTSGNNSANQIHSFSGTPIQGTLSWITRVWNAHSLNSAIDLHCQLTENAKEEWRCETYDLIMDGYLRKLRDHEDKVAAANVEEFEIDFGTNPSQNERIIKEELQRAFLSLLLKTNIKGNNSFTGTDNQAWEYDFSRAEIIGNEIGFLQQAFEWENMSKVFYPEFWGREASWKRSLSKISNNDPIFTDFVSCGAARVQVPVRPEFQESLIGFLLTGEFQGDTSAALLEGQPVFSIAEDFKRSMGVYTPGTPIGAPFEFRLPTTLVRLDDGEEIEFRDVLVQGE